MNQGRKYRSNQPRVTKAPPVWQQEPDPYADYRPVFQRDTTVEQRWEQEEYAQPPYEETTGEPRRTDIVATNTAVRLTCTICAMIGLFAVFMCWAEKESRAIRHFAVQSAALTAVHAACAAALILLGTVLGGVPYLGMMVSLLGWLCYIAVLVMLAILRVRMMQHAWQGRAFRLPGLYRMLKQHM